ncbi:MAG TPA: hypothetical protein VNQ79_27405 [Blastocatellia bacterium]|nr:hypothetical protein [Blastocatellia bacterium]
MNRPDSAFDSFALAPLSAGDIIDRAVRIYRRQFWRLLQIVVWPSLIAYSGVILYTFGMRNFSLERGDARIVLGVLLFTGGIFIYVLGKIAFYVVLGGTSRALVNYFLDGEPLRPREVYRAVRQRFWSLVGATLMVILILGAAFAFLYLLAVMCVMIYVLGAVWLISRLPNWMQITFHVTAGLLAALGLFALWLVVLKRIVFIPQALMVESRDVFSAIGRSFTLAGRDVRQIGAIVLFNLCLTFSLLYLFLLPLGWYAWASGVSLFGSDVPLWYNIAYQTLSQVSEILLAPIAMLGFTLLYIDSRVRREGFDIELLANRCLAAAPLPPPVQPPPPVSRTEEEWPSYSILGLDRYKPEPAPATVTAGAQTAAVATAVLEGEEGRLHTCRHCGHTALIASRFDRFCQTCGTPFDQPVSTNEERSDETH